MIEPVNAAVVAELYRLLPDEERQRCAEIVRDSMPATAKTLFDLHARLPEQEKQRVFEAFRNGIPREAPYVLAMLHRLPDDEWGRFMDQLAPLLFGPMYDEYEMDRGERLRAEFNKARSRKPVNTERNREIIRLRDVEGLSWGEIGQRLRPRIDRSTVKDAYQAQKQRDQPDGGVGE